VVTLRFTLSTFRVIKNDIPSYIIVITIITIKTECHCNFFVDSGGLCRLIVAVVIVHMAWPESSKRLFECFAYLHFAAAADADCCKNTFENVNVTHTHTHAHTSKQM
jgi:hypothetical protein